MNHREPCLNSTPQLATPTLDSRPAPLVLLVSSDRERALRLLSELGQAGFAVAHADSLEGAHDLLERGPVDLVLLDLGLPDGAGAAACESLAQRAPDLPVVVLCDREEEPEAARALGLGAQDRLTWDEAHGRPLARCLLNAMVRQKAVAALHRRALHDALTGVANRRLLEDRIGLALAGLRRGPNPHFALLFLDLDRFKTVNDTLGHAAGDRLLAGVAQRLRQHLRPADTVARLGGDEFAVLLADATDLGAAIHAAERVLALVREPFLVDGHPVRVSASIGIALSTSGYERPDDLLRDADAAMYRAKAAGRDRYRVFDPDMHRSAVALLRMESELREAVERLSFEMHYQPIVSLTSGGVVGVEGLVRWRHPQRGLLPVAQFLAVAEESGLIVPIGWWALAESCRQVRDWQLRLPSQPPLSLHINVSPRLLMEPAMVERLARLLGESDLDPSTLHLEVTERLLLEQGDAGVARLRELHALGVRSSLDDFGTGYSSLSQLGRLRCDAVKIDGCFVRGIANTDGAQDLVETVLALASRLGLGVIAEGVETADQAAALRRLHCPHGQGFWFARPLDAAAAEALLQSPPRWWTQGPRGTAPAVLTAPAGMAHHPGPA